MVVSVHSDAHINKKPILSSILEEKNHDILQNVWIWESQTCIEFLLCTYYLVTLSPFSDLFKP